jgi:drug/metabolite transporter (DMT)-like permease
LCTEEPNTIVLYPGGFRVDGAIGRTPGWLAGIGGVATIGQLTYTRAFVATETSTVMPLTFFKLISAMLLSYLFFAAVADTWTWIGAAAIFGPAVYAARRESQLATPPVGD